MKKLPWTEEEDDVVRNHRGPIKLLLGRLPCRTLMAVASRRKHLGVAAKGSAAWKPAEDRALRRTYPDWQAAQRALPYRTMVAIKYRAKVIRCGVAVDRWSKSEREFLRDHHGKISGRQMAGILGRSEASVWGMKGLMRLKRPPKKAVHPFMADIRDRAFSLGIRPSTLARQVGAKFSFLTARHPSYVKAERAMQLLGGEMYVEWED